MTLLAALLVLFLAHGALSAWLERTGVTAPIVFTTAGLAVCFLVPGLRDREADVGVLLRVAEVGLVLVLFADARRTDLALLRNLRSLPTRLLTTGMLLTLLLGTLLARVVLPTLSWWEAGILAAILAPTDAGLGQVIVSSPQVPTRVRQALNVEAGLNDGLAVPFLLFFAALAADAGSTRLHAFVVDQLGTGALVGVVVGLGGGVLLGAAHRRGTMAAGWQPLAVVVLPLLCVVGCEALGGSMFIAAFVAGLAVQVGFRDAGAHGLEFAEGWGQLLNLSVFFLFGLLGARWFPRLDAAAFAYAALSLTVVRMLPVAVALLGARLDRATVLFVGWFGPRGLASIVLGLVYLEHATHGPGVATIRGAVVATVFVSIFAHGLTARPGIARYARAVAALPSDAPEHAATDLPTPRSSP